MLIAYVRPAYFYNIWFFLMQKVPHPNALSFFMSSFYFFSGFFFKSPENGNEMKYIRSKVKKFIILLTTWLSFLCPLFIARIIY